MRTGYALRPVSLYNTVHTDSFTAIIIIMMIMVMVIIIIIIMIIIIIIIIIIIAFDEVERKPNFGRFWPVILQSWLLCVRLYPGKPTFL